MKCEGGLLKKFRDCSEYDEHEGLCKGKASFGLVFAKTLRGECFYFNENLHTDIGGLK